MENHGAKDRTGFVMGAHQSSSTCNGSYQTQSDTTFIRRKKKKKSKLLFIPSAMKKNSSSKSKIPSRTKIVPPSTISALAKPDDVSSRNTSQLAPGAQQQASLRPPIGGFRHITSPLVPSNNRINSVSSNVNKTSNIPKPVKSTINNTQRHAPARVRQVRPETKADSSLSSTSSSSAAAAAQRQQAAENSSTFSRFKFHPKVPNLLRPNIAPNHASEGVKNGNELDNSSQQQQAKSGLVLPPFKPPSSIKATCKDKPNEGAPGAVATGEANFSLNLLNGRAPLATFETLTPTPMQENKVFGMSCNSASRLNSLRAASTPVCVAVESTTTIDDKSSSAAAVKVENSSVALASRSYVSSGECVTGTQAISRFYARPYRSSFNSLGSGSKGASGRMVKFADEGGFGSHGAAPAANEIEHGKMGDICEAKGDICKESHASEFSPKNRTKSSPSSDYGSSVSGEADEDYLEDDEYGVKRGERRSTSGDSHERVLHFDLSRSGGSTKTKRKNLPIKSHAELITEEDEETERTTSRSETADSLLATSDEASSLRLTTSNNNAHSRASHNEENIKCTKHSSLNSLKAAAKGFFNRNKRDVHESASETFSDASGNMSNNTIHSYVNQPTSPNQHTHHAIINNDADHVLHTKDDLLQVISRMRKDLLCLQTAFSIQGCNMSGSLPMQLSPITSPHSASSFNLCCAEEEQHMKARNQRAGRFATSISYDTTGTDSVSSIEALRAQNALLCELLVKRDTEIANLNEELRRLKNVC